MNEETMKGELLDLTENIQEEMINFVAKNYYPGTVTKFIDKNFYKIKERERRYESLQITFLLMKIAELQLEIQKLSMIDYLNND